MHHPITVLVTRLSAVSCTLLLILTNFFSERVEQFQTENHSPINSTLVLMANIFDLTLIRAIRLRPQWCVMVNNQEGFHSFYKIINLTVENLNFVRCSTRSPNLGVLITLEIKLPCDFERVILILLVMGLY